MIVELQKFEESTDLLFRSVARFTVAEKAFVCLCSGIVAGTCAHQVGSWLLSLVIGPLVAAVVFVASKRPQHFRLRVTNLEFSFGESGASFPNTNSVPRADIRYLEHRGPQGDDSPCGLYAALDHGGRCLLPHLTEAQASEVIDAIYTRFPDMAVASRTFSPGGHLTLLGL